MASLYIVLGAALLALVIVVYTWWEDHDGGPK